MSRFIFQGKESNEITLMKGATYTIPVDIIGDDGEYVNKDTIVVEIFDADNRSGSATLSITADSDQIITLTDAVTGSWDQLSHATTYYAWGVATSGSDTYIGNNSSELEVI